MKRKMRQVGVLISYSNLAELAKVAEGVVASRLKCREGAVMPRGPYIKPPSVCPLPLNHNIVLPHSVIIRLRGWECESEGSLGKDLG